MRPSKKPHFLKQANYLPIIVILFGGKVAGII